MVRRRMQKLRDFGGDYLNQRYKKKMGVCRHAVEERMCFVLLNRCFGILFDQARRTKRTKGEKRERKPVMERVCYVEGTRMYGSGDEKYKFWWSGGSEGNNGVGRSA